MECDDANEIRSTKYTEEDLSDTSNAAVNSLILDYYKKFGRKRDLEQYFSLSTAQSDIRDTNSSFWRSMKNQNESSDSGEKKSESSTELCRISIKCTIPEPSTSQDENYKRATDSDSPPIITEDVAPTSKQSDYDLDKSDDDQSQKSADATFDTSMNKPFSPTSSVTSQRKLEWDSLADVGYGHESSRKTSGSSLSTLERLALKQQYSNNDSKELGHPTAHSTLLDETGDKLKPKRQINKTTKIHRKDVDFIEVNMPHGSRKPPSQAINVNLTKHISFNVDQTGSIHIDDANSKPDKVSVETEITPLVKMDRESQTSLRKTSEKDTATDNQSFPIEQPISVPLSVNTLRRRNRKKRALRKKSKTRAKSRSNKENEPVKPKSVEQISEAESFEYMPGHIYNQNQLRQEAKTSSNVGNKSSLESSGNATTDSSKVSKVSFNRDLEKSVKLLKEVLKGSCSDEALKKKLIKSVVKRLLDSQYKDDDSSTDFLSGLSYSSHKLGFGDANNTTTSTSDNTGEKVKLPKKSILRVDKFNPNVIASSSQSAPNLPVVTNQDIPVISNLVKPSLTSTTESDSGKEKELDANKASSEELYQKYIEALRREAAYKKHLREKQNLLKTKLVASDNSLQPEARVHNRIKELMKDLTRNNYDDGSGDASKLEGGSNTYPDDQQHGISRSQRSHSVFTLNSSGASGSHKHKWNFKKKLKHEGKHEVKHADGGCNASVENSGTCSSKGIYYKVEVCDSAVQVDIECINDNDTVPPLEPIRESPKNIAHIVSDEATGDVKYVCLCPSDSKNYKTTPENILIYKCSRLNNTQQLSVSETDSAEKEVKYTEFCQPSTSKQSEGFAINLPEKSSQTDIHSNQGPIIINQTETVETNAINLITPNLISIEEATRCLQTEISINPTIIEPSFSDVNFIKDEDCAVLVSEQYKIPKAVPELQCGDDSKQSLTGTSKSGLKKYFQHHPNTESSSDENQNKLDPCNIQTTSKPSYDTLPTAINEMKAIHQVRRQDNIAIPIEGTNMTLMVTFNADAKSEIGVQSQGTFTYKPEVAEKATSLFEECTKGVQSQVTGLFKQIDKITLPCSHTKRPPKTSAELRDKRENTKYYTHPKAGIVIDKKYFFRSNTDPMLLDMPRPANLPLQTTCMKSTNVYPIEVERKDYSKRTSPNHFSSDHSDKDKDSSKQHDSPKEYNDENFSSSATPQLPVSNDQSSYHLTGKDDSAYFKITNSPKWSVKSPNRKGSAYRKKAKNKDSLDELKEPILDMIRVITKRFSKSSLELKEKKRLKDIINALSYLLDTDESGNVPNTSDSQSPSANASHASLTKSAQKLAGLLNSANYTCKMAMSDTQLPHTKAKKTSIDYEANIGHPGENCLRNGCKYCVELEKIDINIQHPPADVYDIAMDSRYGNAYTSCSRDDKRLNQPCKLNMNEIKLRNIGQNKQNDVKDVTEDKNKDIENNCQSGKVKIGEEVLLKKKFKKKPKPPTQPCESHEVLTQLHPKSNIQDKFCELIHGMMASPREAEHVKMGYKDVEKDSPRNPCEEQTSTEDVNSTDSTTCKRLTNVQKQSCQWRCKTCHSKYIPSCSNNSSTCNVCKRMHYCSCGTKSQKNKKNIDNAKKKSIAYNLIVQTSDSISEETLSERHAKQLKNIVVKVPPRRKQKDLPFREVSAKIEKNLPRVLSYEEMRPDSHFIRNDDASSSDGIVKHTDVFTVRKYLEKNRPEFVDKSTQRQNCIKLISEKRASEREAQRRLLSLHVDKREALSNLNIDELRMLAEELGIDIKKKDKPKFIHEKEMKKHSEKIYKTLPEVTQKKEQIRKDNTKKTNLLMADIFKKNLQRRTLKGNVNLSNYSAVLKL